MQPYKISRYQVWACGPHGQLIGSNEIQVGAPIQLAEDRASGLFYESIEYGDWEGWEIEVLSEDGSETVYSETVDNLLIDK